jgi:uncharacterized membrane protein HdeD (DUF308 family)
LIQRKVGRVRRGQDQQIRVRTAASWPAADRSREMTAITHHHLPPTRGSAKRRPPLVVYGIFLVAAGLAAAAMPLMATFTASLMFGGLLLGSGIVGAISSVATWSAKGAFWRLLWAVVAVLAGVCIAFHPWSGALTLTLLLGVSLVVQGLIGLIYAVHHRKECRRAWAWMAIGSLLTAFLGGMLIVALPGAGLIVPGMFLAVSFLCFGFSVIAAGFAKRPAEAEA